MSDPKAPGIIKFSQANDVLRRGIGYHTCPWARMSLRQSVFPSRPIGTLWWTRTGGSWRSAWSVRWRSWFGRSQVPSADDSADAVSGP